MSSHRLQSDPIVGLRGLPSVSRFRSGHMPSGTNVITGIDISPDSGLDTFSSSEEECNGSRYSLEASPQDGNLSAVGNKFFSDESSESVSCSEVSSTTSRSTNDSLLTGKDKAGSDSFGSTVRSDYISRQNLRYTPPLNKFSDAIPSAPPLNGSFRKTNQVLGDESKPSFAASGSSSNETAPSMHKGRALHANENSDNHEASPRTAAASSTSHPLSGPARYPTYHASGLGYWYSMLSYDACVRMCLHFWDKGCVEAPIFLKNECALLIDAFGLRRVLLQPEEELLRKDSPELVGEGASMKIKKTIGKIKIQVRKVTMGIEPHVIVGTRRCLKEVPQRIKIFFNSWRCSSPNYEEVKESYTCSLRLKSSPEVDAVKMQPGSSETRVFLPDGLGDELIIEVHDSKGKHCGNAVVQTADIADESGEKLRSCIIYHEPEHEQVGKIQLYINYTTTAYENSHKCSSVAETIAYDCVLETAMKVQQFQQRNLLLHGPWKWLVTEFASYYGVSNAYSKLRYLSYVMHVATPTADCLELVHDLLLPVIRDKTKHTLSHQEIRLLREVSEEIEQILTLVFENFKSLDESSPLGLIDVFGPATGVAAPALAPALKLYKLLHNILLPEAQSKLCRYFQNATKKRARRHLSETDEFVSGNKMSMDTVALSTAYKKMKSLCLNIRNEILTDIEIQKQGLLPSFIDLPNLSSSIYSSELYSRLRAFLGSCPPPGPTPPVIEFIIATADFQRDLSLWNIGYKDGADSKELFNVYITRWIQEKRLALLDFCKFVKVKAPCSFPTQHSTASFIDATYDRLKETIAEYDVIISRWPEYAFTLENAIADVEKAVLECLQKQHAEVLSPLKDNSTPIKFGLRYVLKFTKGNPSPYTISTELGIFLNSMKRMLDILRPQIEAKVKAWGSCIPERGNMVPGESLSEVTVMIRTKFRAYVQAVTDKLVENTKLQDITKLKKIIRSAKENATESDIRRRMQPLKELLTSTIDQLHDVLDTQVFVIVCRGFWDRMGQDMLKFLEGRKENKTRYKALRVALTVLDDTFGSQMHQLLGNAVQEKDIEAPTCIMEVRSMLCKDKLCPRVSCYC